ncbi:MAG: tRNA preQ1(34) S-adenosylmethionine ribosyltransferase-isomerase QueA [Hyphomicrobium sp.]
MRTDLFDFELPEDRIALHPASPRDSARLLVAGGEGRMDLTVGDLPDLLAPGDALVFNDTRVIPAALEGVRVRGALRANVAFNLIKRVGADRWRAFARPAKRLEVGDTLEFQAYGDSADSALKRASGVGLPLLAHVSDKGEAGEVELIFDRSGAGLDAAIGVIGRMPLPPYIALKRKTNAGDASTYQTIYAARDGAVAAPTAGLHFTPGLFERLDARGISRHFVTLHVGAGTFLPVKAGDTADHKMHSEWGEISAGTAAALNAVRSRGGRVVAVGTTSLRILESATPDGGDTGAWSGDTAIFITPGYRFKAVDVLMTNFHLPRSTLFMLVSAFSGLEVMQAAYAHAIASGYRFYSYGDACLLFPREVGGLNG